MSSIPTTLGPKIPQQVSVYAKTCLIALSQEQLGKLLSLGGAMGLSYYFEYRTTHDVDAWWEEEAGETEQRIVIQCLESALRPFGSVSIRRWGDVVSVELTPAGENRVAFSFQIARRSVRLELPLLAPWPETLFLDSLNDLLASKMVALVERGAPRDFRDIYTLCQAELVSPVRCWRLWKKHQELSGDDQDTHRASLAILTHLSRIASQRPLDSIQNPQERQSAVHLREWFGRDFLNALLD